VPGRKKKLESKSRREITKRAGAVKKVCRFKRRGDHAEVGAAEDKTDGPFD